MLSVGFLFVCLFACLLATLLKNVWTGCDGMVIGAWLNFGDNPKSPC